MKYGIRKPNIKKSIKARTTGKMKRNLKKSVNPLYGKKGIGFINDPKKAAYNAVYSRTTFGISDVPIGVTNTGNENTKPSLGNAPSEKQYPMKTHSIYGTSLLILGNLLVIIGLVLLLISPIGGLAAIIFGALCSIIGFIYRKTAKK